MLWVDMHASMHPEPEDNNYEGIEREDQKEMHKIRSLRYSPDSRRRGNNNKDAAAAATSPRGEYKHRSIESVLPRWSSPLSRSASRRSVSRSRKTPSPTPSAASIRSKSRKSHDSGSGSLHPSLSRSSSRMAGSTPIMFSNSTGQKVKPPAIRKDLNCTLEELCYGCMKKVKVTRDVLTETGQIIKEEEILTIKVKPGWKSGTKITFEGMGNERPGTSPADVTFVIGETKHPLFRREGDDLEIGIEIPLVKALTGCEISIPLLGGEETRLSIDDDIIHHGYEKIIPGQGMPISKHQGKRGDLKVVFLVDFPTHLTPQQRSDIVNILEDHNIASNWVLITSCI
ncbi:hypothetical protein Tsubulata_024407 [Turnera subulata]|uniref:Chaperone DnaJ C-terminal domain-containing protein n=1 Tax=Turnera subulata TaxID=218843 RepID=A0A9Q0FW61_9ROSI|nr:hypothetical protein Tsubulata_024407 [Turnera subulata]